MFKQGEPEGLHQAKAKLKAYASPPQFVPTACLSPKKVAGRFVSLKRAGKQRGP